MTGTRPGYQSGVEAPARRTVHLLAVPLAVLVELQLYFDDMVRELQLIAVGQADAGEDISDLVVDLRPSGVAASRALLPLVDAFDDASRDGELLAAPCTPTARHLLEWIVDEIELQLVSGKPPRPFTSGAGV